MVKMLRKGPSEAGKLLVESVQPRMAASLPDLKIVKFFEVNSIEEVVLDNLVAVTLTAPKPTGRAVNESVVCIPRHKLMFSRRRTSPSAGILDEQIG